jgi:hypothetical protein
MRSTSVWRAPRYALMVPAVMVLSAVCVTAQPPPPLPRDPRTASPQTPTQGLPPRDRVPPPRVGTGVLRGRVVDGVTGHAIVRARVRISNSQGLTGMKDPVLTDDTGAFEFTALPPGPYSIAVEKSTYVTTSYPDPGRSLRSRSQPFVLRDAQVVDDIVVSLFHGGVITGRVVDAHGDPLENATVNVLWLPRGGKPTMRGGTQTNDLGEFRVTRLQPGRYFVRVRAQMFFDGGGAPPERPLPQPIPMYYPGVLALSEARPVVVNRGETVGGVDVMLAEGTPTLVNGTVVTSDGQPMGGGSVTARMVGAEAVISEGAGGGGIRPDGTFRMQLTPGEYLLEARLMQRSMPNQPPSPAPEQFGSARITIGGAPSETVTIMMGRGATASGRVVFEGDTPPPPSPGQVGIPLFNPEGMCRAGQAVIAQDWSFKVDSLFGTCSGSQSGMFGRWMLKAVMFRGQNLLDQPVTFEQGQHYGNVQVVVTDRRTRLELRVSDETGQQTRDYVAIVFPVEKQRWTTSNSRYIRTFVSTAPPAVGTSRGPVVISTRLEVTAGFVPPSGSFQIGAVGGLSGLPAGEYYVIAIDDIDTEDSRDPGVLERLATSATRVIVAEEAPTEVALRRLTLAEILR